ncbi:hypothetical protein PGB90_005797 [Kerria lacca]
MCPQWRNGLQAEVSRFSNQGAEERFLAWSIDGNWKVGSDIDPVAEQLCRVEFPYLGTRARARGSKSGSCSGLEVDNSSEAEIEGKYYTTWGTVATPQLVGRRAGGGHQPGGRWGSGSHIRGVGLADQAKVDARGSCPVDASTQTDDTTDDIISLTASIGTERVDSAEISNNRDIQSLLNIFKKINSYELIDERTILNWLDDTHENTRNDIQDISNPQLAVSILNKDLTLNMTQKNNFNYFSDQNILNTHEALEKTRALELLVAPLMAIPFNAQGASSGACGECDREPLYILFLTSQRLPYCGHSFKHRSASYSSYDSIFPTVTTDSSQLIDHESAIHPCTCVFAVPENALLRFTFADYHPVFCKLIETLDKFMSFIGSQRNSPKMPIFPNKDSNKAINEKGTDWHPFIKKMIAKCALMEMMVGLLS